MPTTQIAPLLIQSFKDNNGNPLVGGSLYTYVAGTSTPQSTYIDSTGVTVNPNPVVLNSRGEAPVWLTLNQAYKFALYDASNTLIYTVDQVIGNSTPTVVSNIAMNGYKLTGLGAGTVPGDSLRYENLSDIQAQTFTAFTTTGTSAAYTLTTSPVITSLLNNQRYQVAWHVANTTTTPTLVRDGLAVKNIKVYDISGNKVNPVIGAFGLNVRTDLVYDGVDFVACNLAPVMPSLLLANGYQKLASGLILQWVSGTVAVGGTAITYPIPFPTASLMVVGNTNPNNTGVFLSTYNNLLGGTSVVAYNTSAASIASNFNIFAIGY